MSNINNLSAEIGANYVGDDAQPAVSFQNTSTGPGLQIFGAVIASTASIDVANITKVTVAGNVSASPALVLNKTVLSGATAALISLDLGSTASVPAIQLVGQSFVSAVSIVFAASANWAGMGVVRVLLPDGTNYGWIPVLPTAVVTGAARG